MIDSALQVRLWCMYVTSTEVTRKRLTWVTQEENKQQLDRADAWNEKVGGGIELCARPASLTDARDTSPPADDDAASEKAATLDDVTSPDIGVGGEHIDTDKRFDTFQH